MIVFADTPTLGLLFGVPVAILATLLTIAGVIGLVMSWRSRNSYGSDDQAVIGGGLLVCGLVIGAINMWALWPYQHDYHFWMPVTGKVSQVSKRLVPAGEKSMMERYVLVIDGKPYGVDDTRASLVKPGQTVSIACKREYQWGSRDHGYGCKWDGGVQR